MKQDIEKYFFDAEHMKSASDGDFEHVIVFGTSGKPVRATDSEPVTTGK